MAHHRESRWNDESKQSDLRTPLFGVPKQATTLGTVERIPATKTRPRRVYYIDSTGRRWRVYDAVYGPPDTDAWREIAYPPPRVNAKHRVFVAANGDRRLFSFASRHGPPSAKNLGLDPQTITDQFLWASSPASTREEYDDPRRDRAVLPDPKWVPTEQHALRVHTSNLNRWTAFSAE